MAETVYIRVNSSKNLNHKNPCAFPLHIGENKLVILQKVGYPQSYLRTIHFTISKYKNVTVGNIIEMGDRLKDFQNIEAISITSTSYITDLVCEQLERLGAEC